MNCSRCYYLLEDCRCQTMTVPESGQPFARVESLNTDDGYVVKVGESIVYSCLLENDCFTDDMAFGSARAVAANLNVAVAPLQAKAELADRMLEALLWCGGSSDFSPGGQAHEGWKKLVRPIFAAYDALNTKAGEAK